jgi:hypothetical protein
MNKEAASIACEGIERLRRSFPNFDYMLTRLRLHPDNTQPTLAVTGSLLVVYNEDMLPRYRNSNAILIGHEMCHPLLNHFKRAEELALAGWEIRFDAVKHIALAVYGITHFRQLCNFGGDIECNAVMKHCATGAAGFEWPSDIPLFTEASPGAQLNDTLETFVTRTIERWEKLKIPPKPGSGGTHHSHCCNHDAPPDAPIGAAPDEVDLCRKSVAQAIANNPHTRGTGGLLERWAQQQLLPPKVHWIQHLRNFVRTASDYGRRRGTTRTYRRLSRMTNALYPTLGCSAPILPTYKSERYRVDILCDTSGSMHSRLRRACSEILPLTKEAEVFGHGGDWDLNNSLPIRTQEDLDQLLVGGGGTSMARIYAQILEKFSPQVLFIFTDGETDWPPAPIPVPTLVIICSERPDSIIVPAYLPTVRVTTD